MNEGGSSGKAGASKAMPWARTVQRASDMPRDKLKSISKVAKFVSSTQLIILCNLHGEAV